MAGFRLVDWNDAYENRAHIAGSAEIIDSWQVRAQRFRQHSDNELDIHYGCGERARYDLFFPATAAQGLLVFVHGGYWQHFDKSCWSHLARGGVENGWAVMMPSYDLCPVIDVAGIESMIGAAISHAAARIDGPIVLTGHSAGGQLVASMVCENSPLSPALLERVQHTMPISGLFDLRPLIHTRLNDALHLDLHSAAASSPALKLPIAGARVTTWVGAAERSEFVRQSALLANVWRGLGAWTECIEEPDRHHFNIIDALHDPASPLMTSALCAERIT